MNLTWYWFRFQRSLAQWFKRGCPLHPMVGGGLVAALFFVAGVFTLSDYGATVDEFESFRGARTYARIVGAVLTGDIPPAWPFHEIPGYYFLTDLIRHGVASLVTAFDGSYRVGFHLANLILSTLSVFLLHRICLKLTQNARIAVLAALTLALLPQFIAHSQNNPKDLIALFAMVLGVWAWVEVYSSKKTGWLIVGCAALGWSYTTTPFSALLVPLGVLWLAIFERESLVLHPRKYLILLLGGMGGAFLLWPWLWANPVSHAVAVAKRLSQFEFNTREMYLNRLWLVSELPWHYVPLHLLASLPSTFLMAGCLNWDRGWKRSSIPRNEISLLGLALLWLGMGLIVSFHSSLKYNAMRHFLFILPAVAILVGLGLERIFALLRPAWATGLMILLFAIPFAALVRIHPYPGAYVNAAVNAFIPDHAERYLSLEYFGQAYLEGARWLNKNQEPEARTVVPIFGFLANSALRKRSVVGTLDDFRDPTRTTYLMFITRGSRYTPFIDYVQAHSDPVFEIRRGKATLLRIFKNQHLHADGSN